MCALVCLLLLSFRSLSHMHLSSYWAVDHNSDTGSPLGHRQDFDRAVLFCRGSRRFNLYFPPPSGCLHYLPHDHLPTPSMPAIMGPILLTFLSLWLLRFFLLPHLRTLFFKLVITLGPSGSQQSSYFKVSLLAASIPSATLIPLCHVT